DPVGERENEPGRADKRQYCAIRKGNGDVPAAGSNAASIGGGSRRPVAGAVRQPLPVTAARIRPNHAPAPVARSTAPSFLGRARPTATATLRTTCAFIPKA